MPTLGVDTLPSQRVPQKILKKVSPYTIPRSDTEQTNGMVSSLWVVADCVGGLIGSILGSAAYDSVGFEMGTLYISIVMICTVLIVLLYSVRRKSMRHVRVLAL